jgi:putative ABC transport system substrate-binding protein
VATEGDWVNRRDAILGLLALGFAPFASIAQQAGKVWRIGFLSGNSGPTESTKAFDEQLRVLGYIEGRNLVLEYRFGSNKEERLPEMAAELVRLKVDVIVASATLPVAAAKRATSTIPIVMTSPSDAVGSGLVASLARPGSNVTGLTYRSPELAGKRLQLLREVLPKATRVAALLYKGSSNTADLILEQLNLAAREMGITLIVLHVREASGLADVFAAMRRERAQALFVQSTPFSNDYRERILQLAAEQHLPTLFEGRESVEQGGLMSYGPSLPGMYGRAAYYVDRIVKGAKPADLPVEQPSKFELVVNLKTAKALGIKIPQSVLIRATEVIQ